MPRPSRAPPRRHPPCRTGRSSRPPSIPRSASPGSARATSISTAQRSPIPEPLREGAYRDKDKRLKRQAARFRVYGCNARGDIIRELTTEGSDAEIEWHVQLANKKSAWFGFQLALDIPEASYAVPTTPRNPGITDRSRLAITPSAKSLRGGNAGPVAFDDGVFMDLPVYLGEMRTDADQRLTVLGGRGAARSYDGSAAITFANNEGWHDDVSDGPVTATVRLHGEPLEVVPAWVVIAPPNYGPQRKSVRTMWDVMRRCGDQREHASRAGQAVLHR